MDSLSSAGTHKAISLNAHCLVGTDHLMLGLTCLSLEKFLQDSRNLQVLW